jgi:Tfp pilus assembly protein PilW
MLMKDQLINDESGFTMVELLVGMISFIVIFGVVMQMVTVATHNQDRIAQRVAADQRVRPVMTRIMDSLHSACVAPLVAPVATGSTATSITFISKSGATVTPVPDRRVITLTGTTLTQNVYPATGGAAPSWTFSGTPSSTATLLTNVSAPGGVVFKYYDYVSGALNPTPLAVPLSATSASRTAYVTVSLTAQPPRGASSIDTKSAITVSDSTALRLGAAQQSTAQDNPPCA